MLVLSRRLGERIVLPSLGVTIQVVAIKSGAVRIGIEAPSDISIVREEIFDHSPLSAVARTGQGSLEPCGI